MSVITIRLPEKMLHDIDKGAHLIKVPRAAYIRLAIEHMNQDVQNKQRAEKLKKSSLRIRKESMRINKEFSKIEYDPKD